VQCILVKTAAEEESRKEVGSALASMLVTVAPSSLFQFKEVA
jgi:hypothetical protein